MQKTWVEQGIASLNFFATFNALVLFVAFHD